MEDQEQTTGKSSLQKRDEVIDAVIAGAKEKPSKEKASVRCAKIEGRIYLDLDDMWNWLTGIQLHPRANKHTKQELGRVKNGLLDFRKNAQELPDTPIINKPADQQ